MNKKIIFIIFAVVLTIDSCRKSDYIPAPKIELGTKSTTMNFISSPLLNNTNSYTFQVSVTPGSKYSFQINDINGNVVKSQGLVADETIESITINVDKIKSGIYDLIFMDIEGNELKYPIIVK